MSNDLLLDGYAAKTCTYALHLSRVENPADRIDPSAVALHRLESGNIFEDAVGRLLMNQAPPQSLAFFPRDVDRSIDESKWSSDRRDRLQGTLSHVAARTKVIWNPRLAPDPLGHRSGEPDIVVEVSIADDLSGYAPVDVKAHHTLTARFRPDGSVSLPSIFFAGESSIELQSPDCSSHKEDLIQLAHYWRMLEAQGAAPNTEPFGAIIGSSSVDGELAVLTWFDLTDVMGIYDEAFADALQVVKHAQEIAGGEEKEPLGVAWYTPKCHDCGWRAVCGPQMLERSDVSLVRPSRFIVDELDEFNIETISDLASVDRSRMRPNGEPISSSTAWRESIRRAQLALAGDPLPFSLLPELRQPIRSPRIWRRADADVSWMLPGADVELDVDMECTTSNVYLWGTLLTYRTTSVIDQIQDGYRGFGDEFPLDIERAENQVFLSFWHFLQSTVARCREQGLSFRAYCYSDAENRWMRRCADRIDAEQHRCGIDSLRVAVDEFIASAMWVDLLREMKLRAESLNGMGLKNVAKALGFEWHSKDAGGEASMLWYEYATKDPDPDIRHRWRVEIIEYNEDDVKATRYLRDWFATHDMCDLSTVER